MNIGATGPRPTSTGRLPEAPPVAPETAAVPTSATKVVAAGKAAGDQLATAIDASFDAPELADLPELAPHPDQALLDDLYGTMLDRAPDGEGLTQFSKMIAERRAQGMSEDDIRAFVTKEIEGSAEYQAKAGPTEGAPATAPVGESNAATKGQTPYINQYHPDGEGAGYSNGDSNCGPTSMAMVARSFGYGEGKTDAQLIMELGAMGGTSGDGTGVNGIVAMAAGIGKAGEIRGPGANTDWIAEQLKAGKQVVANGDYYAMGDHNRAKVGAGGHYVAVVGQDASGNFLVNDPADAKYNPKAFSASELATFISSNTNGGYQVAIG